MASFRTKVYVRCKVRNLGDLFDIRNDSVPVTTNIKSFATKVVDIFFVFCYRLDKTIFLVVQLLNLFCSLAIGKDTLRAGLQSERILSVGNFLAFEGH